MDNYIIIVSSFFLYGKAGVGIETDYGLDGPGIESRSGRLFP